MMKKTQLFFLISLLVLFALPVQAQEEAQASVTSQTLEIYDASSFESEGTIELPYEFEDISYEVADLGRDGQAEIIIGSSEGYDPEIFVFRKDGSLIKTLPVYTKGYRGGVIVAAADMNNDGSVDFVTGTREGGGPHIKVMTSNGDMISEWFAFDADYRGGVTLAVGDITDKFGGTEIIVAKAEGEKALLRIFSFDGQLISEWYPFGPDFLGGLNIDIAPDGNILVARAFGQSPLVRIMNRFGGLEGEVMAYYDAFAGGVHAQAIPTGGETWDLYTSPGFSGGPHIRNFTSDGRLLSPGFNAFSGEFKGGIIFRDADIDGDGELELIVAKETLSTGPHTTVKSILVDLSEQKLYSYYRGEIESEYLISSGLSRFETPKGDFAITRKREKTRMSWVYGPDHPDNYDLPDVPHAMTFVGPYNIHGAYWHNNFGVRMSHGCVNMSLPDAEELFNWADLGTTVVVQD
jgi:hypothetical protein